MAQDEKRVQQSTRALHYNEDNNDHSERENKIKETTHAMALTTTTAMSLQRLHQPMVQIQNLLHQQTQTYNLQSTPTFTAVDNTVDLINPLSNDCTHYILMMGAGGAGKAPPPLPPAPGAAAAGALPVMLPQARLPQPTVFDGTTPPFQEWIQETRNFLSINNYEFVRQVDYSLQFDAEVTLQDVTNSTREGGRRREALHANETGQDDLHRELATPEGERQPGRDNATVERELAALQRAHDDLQRDYDEWQDRLERGGDYLNYVLIHGTKLGTEANNYVRRLQRSTNGFEALRLMRLRYSGGQMLQNYQLLREILNPKFTESQQHFQYRQWLESLSRYELEARQPLDDNLKIATLVNGLRGNLQQMFCCCRSNRLLHGRM